MGQSKQFNPTKSFELQLWYKTLIHFVLLVSNKCRSDNKTMVWLNIIIIIIVRQDKPTKSND